ncbi:MAG: DUF1415 domain-containing protein [Lautropia sp.]
MSLDEQRIAAETRAWVDIAVVGLGLCPFAAGAVAADRLRIVVTPATELTALLDVLDEELRRLAARDAGEVGVSGSAGEPETTLLVHPAVLTDFLDFNDALDAVEARVDALGLAGVIQVASFHPDYRFAGSSADDVGNATNRSPYPTLHLLREASVARAVAAWGDTASIYRRNLKRLAALGTDGWAALSRRWHAGSGPAAPDDRADQADRGTGSEPRGKPRSESHSESGRD